MFFVPLELRGNNLLLCLLLNVSLLIINFSLREGKLLLLNLLMMVLSLLKLLSLLLLLSHKHHKRVILLLDTLKVLGLNLGLLGNNFLSNNNRF